MMKALYPSANEKMFRFSDFLKSLLNMTLSHLRWFEALLSRTLLLWSQRSNVSFDLKHLKTPIIMEPAS
jgi:hypothetical protein